MMIIVTIHHARHQQHHQRQLYNVWEQVRGSPIKAATSFG
jgi:hypothetical protein